MSLLEAAIEVGRFLEERGTRYFAIGSLALQEWGELRSTREVGITVLVPPEELEAFVDAVLKRFPGHFANAREFALRHGVVLFEAAGEVPVYLFLGKPGYQEEAWGRAVWVELPRTGKLRVVVPEDLIIHKCFAGRACDLDDVEGILIRQRLQLDLGLIRSWLDKFRRVVDSHDPREAFEQALARAERALKDRT